MPTITVIPPDLNKSGIWSLKEPFSSYVTNNYSVDLTTLRLKVISITSMKDLILSNLVDPFTTIYQPAGLTEIDYKEDMVNGVPIISLNASTSRGQVIIRVPLNYISALPNNVDVVYRDKVVVIDLGPLPVDVDTLVWKNDLSSFVTQRTGIVPAIKEVQMGVPTFVDHNTNIVNEKTRLNKATVKETYLIKHTKLEGAYTQLLFQYKNVITCFKYAKAFIAQLTHSGSIPFLLANGNINLTDIYNYLIGPPQYVIGSPVDTYLSALKDATIAELLGIINNLNSLSGITLSSGIVSVGGVISLRKGSSFSVTILSAVADNTPYYWTVYKTAGSLDLFETLTGVAYITDGKAIINLYVEAKTVGILDTSVYVYVKNAPGDPGYVSIAPSMTTIETTSSADNYSALYKSTAAIGVNYSTYTGDDDNRTFMSMFYK